ncbi:MAG: hypothetical protein JW900_15235, partial [Anaerolineae bacterium]|nr:hypothetical protein [Anaerolineae bacterium]
MQKRIVLIAAILALAAGVLFNGQNLHAQSALQEAAEAYFSDGPRTIAAADLYENLNDGDADNDPYIISVRSADDYAAGH